MGPSKRRYLTAFLVYMLLGIVALGLGVQEHSVPFLVRGAIAVLIAFIELHEATS